MSNGNETPTDAQESAPRQPPPLPRPTPHPADYRCVMPPPRAPASPFGEEFAPMEQVSIFGTVDALLKRPARLAYELSRGRRTAVCLFLLLITLACSATYGFIVGTFSGGHQLWAVPLKTVVGLLLSAMICFPSLYILACLGGSRLSVQEVWGMLLLALALSSLLLVGFAPVAWVFSESTSTTSFMGGLHMAFWIVAIGFGVSLLIRASSFLNNGAQTNMRLWSAVFIVVILQMTTTLRPLVGPYQGLGLQGRKPFLSHWGDCLRSNR
jgi:hypothetical protein